MLYPELAIFGAKAGQGAPISWVAIHRRHHEFGDLEGDLHSPNLSGDGLRGKVPIFRPEVRAVVFDESSALSNAGAYGVSDLDTVRHTFSGRVARQMKAQGIDEEAFLTRAEQQLNPYVPVARSDRIQFASRTFDPGLCAFSVDTAQINRQLATQVSVRGASFTGDYCKGASIEACFVAARDCVNRMVERTPLQ